MCEFVSWIEKGEKVLYLTDELLLNTPKGELYRRQTNNVEDWEGHGAIRFFFEIEAGEGLNKECVDFSSPVNFPPQIVKAIKNCEFTKIGCLPNHVFTAKALAKLKADAEWKKADAERKKADAEWKKADAEREKTYAEWKKTYAEREKTYAERKKAYAEWKKTDARIKWGLFSDSNNRIPIWRD